MVWVPRLLRGLQGVLRHHLDGEGAEPASRGERTEDGNGIVNGGW